MKLIFKIQISDKNIRFFLPFRLHGHLNFPLISVMFQSIFCFSFRSLILHFIDADVFVSTFNVSLCVYFIRGFKINLINLVYRWLALWQMVKVLCILYIDGPHFLN